MAALWLVVIIGITGYELSVRSRTHRLGVANALEYTQAAAAADAALETVRANLETRLIHPLSARARFSPNQAIDPWSDLSHLSVDTITLGDERAVAHVYDAGSRLQINRASESDIQRLLTGLRIDAAVADRLAQRIMDWRDADDLHRAKGLERDDYLRIGARRLPRNADFTNIDELKDVDGVTPDIYRLITPHVTTFGAGQININAAPAPVLRSLPGVSEETISVITHAQADARPLRTLEELTQRLSSGARAAIVDAGSELMQRITFETREVVAESEGWVTGSPVRVRAESVYARGGDALFTVWQRIEQ